jgi:protein-L-isoaspartate O-methyltransferase
MAGVPYYDVHAQQLTEQYESLEAHAVHHWLMDLLPMGSNSRALDVGAGSGRDAAWLVSRGFEVAVRSLKQKVTHHAGLEAA